MKHKKEVEILIDDLTKEEITELDYIQATIVQRFPVLYPTTPPHPITKEVENILHFKNEENANRFVAILSQVKITKKRMTK